MVPRFGQRPPVTHGALVWDSADAILVQLDAGQTEAGARQSHCRVTSLQAINVINHLRAQTLAQREWGFSEEHCRVAHYWDSSLDSTACSNHARQTLQSYAPCSQQALIDEAPFSIPYCFLCSAGIFQP